MACTIIYKGQKFNSDEEFLAYARLNRLADVNAVISSTLFKQKAGTTMKSASPKAVGEMKEWLKRIGVEVKPLADYLSSDINGMADYLDAAVSIAQGKEDVALVEEGMHFMEEIVRQTNPILHTTLLNQITAAPEYREVMDEYGNDPSYQIAGKPNIVKLKREALVKALSNAYVTKDDPRSWLQKVIDWFRQLFEKAKFIPFQALDQVEDELFNFTNRNRDLAKFIVENMNKTTTREVEFMETDTEGVASLKTKKIVNENFNYTLFKQAYEAGDYGSILTFAVDQLSNNGPIEEAENSDGYWKTVDSLFGGDEEMAIKVLSASGKFYQKTPSTEEQKRIEDALTQKLQDFTIKKIPTIRKDVGGEEEPSNKYIKTIAGVISDVLKRVTDVAKEQVKKLYRGKDYLNNRTDEQKRDDKSKAMNGDSIHKDAEEISNAALNPDGTVMTRDRVNLSGYKPATLPAVYNALKNYLLGDDNGSVGLLYTYPVGTKFKIEQIVYDDKKDEAGTLDFLALMPDGKMEIIDWKSMGFNLARNPDIPQNKRQQHQFQLNEYRQILVKAYGVKYQDITARTIPIHVQYRMKSVKDSEGKRITVPKMVGITIGKVNVKDETESYLLGVVPDDQTSGNAEVDSLVLSLRSWYKKLYERRITPEEKEMRDSEAATLSTAIRNLQVAQNFDPIVNQAALFEANATKILAKYTQLSKKPISDLSRDTLNEALAELKSIIYVAEKYANLDDVFLSAYPEDLSEKQQKTFNAIKNVTYAAKAKRGALFNLLTEFAVNIAENEGVRDINMAERELQGFIKDFRALGEQSNKALQTWFSLFTKAKGKAKIRTQETLDTYSKVYTDFVNWSGGKTGKELLATISQKDNHELIDEVSGDMWSSLNKAKANNDKKWVEDNVDRAEYNRLYKESYAKKKTWVEDDIYNGDEEEVARQKNARLVAFNEIYSLDSPNFYGFDNWIVKKTLKRDAWETPEYKALKRSENAPALAMWKFIRSINGRAMKSGYLPSRRSLQFLPFMKASALQRVFGSDEGMWKAMMGSAKDKLTVQIDDEFDNSRKDPETGEQKRTIPKPFTTDISLETKDGKKDYSQISHDINKIIPAYIKSVIEYEAHSDLEDIAETLIMLEQSKKHLEINKQGDIVMKNGVPEKFAGNERNTQVLQSYVDSQLYRSNLSAGIGDKFLNIMSGGDENKKLSAMKTIQAANKLTQLKALAIKLSIGIPNAFGSNLQGLINSGRFYKGRDFGSSEIKVIGSYFRSPEGNIELGLLDYFQLLPDELLKHTERKNAQGLFEKIKYWSMSDLLMTNLSIPDNIIHLANGRAFIENTMVEGGKLVNIREYLRSLPEWKTRYDRAITSPEQMKQIEKEFEPKVKLLQQTRALKKVAIINAKGYLEIPGIKRDSDDVAKYRSYMIQTGNNITGKMSDESKRLYTDDIIKRSFMMFKNWIVPLGEIRFSEFKYNKSLDKWDYGRTRLFWKTAAHLGIKNIARIKDIVTATPKGIKIMDEILQRKKDDYFKKHGAELTITEQEWYDLMRGEIKRALRDASYALSLISMVLWAHIAAPPPDSDEQTQNLFKLLAKNINKSADELWFYYNPTSFDSIVRGTVLPSIGVLTDAEKVIEHTAKWVGGVAFENQKWIDAAHPTKALLNMFPISSQFASEFLPAFYPDVAKELGIRVNPQSRPNR